MRTHKRKIEAQNMGLTSEQVRRNKNAQTKQRGEQRKADNIARQNELSRQWRALTPTEQLKRLPKGGAAKQRAKITARIARKAA